MNSDITSDSGFISNSQGLDISNLFTDISVISDKGSFCIHKGRRFGKWFAIKSVSTKYEGIDTYSQILQREFQIGIILQHPHIVQTYSIEDVPEIGKSIIMEYVDGMTLAQYLLTTPTEQEKEKITQELFSAISYLHEHQIIHRDLKPSNILVTHNSHNLKIIDLGLSIEDASATMTQPAGTQGYMPPEQMQKESKADCRADIYAIGILLSKIWDNPTKSVRNIIAKCTEQNADKRPANIYELQKLWNKKNKGHKLILTALGICTGLIFAFILWKANTKDETEQLITKQQTETTSIDVNKDTATIILNDTVNKKTQITEEETKDKTVTKTVERKQEKKKTEETTASTKDDIQICKDSIAMLYEKYKAELNGIRPVGIITSEEMFSVSNKFATNTTTIIENYKKRHSNDSNLTESIYALQLTASDYVKKIQGDGQKESLKLYYEYKTIYSKLSQLWEEMQKDWKYVVDIRGNVTMAKKTEDDIRKEKEMEQSLIKQHDSIMNLQKMIDYRIKE